jgi:hypothetical protein
MNRVWEQYISEQWTDEARAAAAAARKKRSGGKRVGAGFTPHKEYSKSMGSRFKSVGNKLKSAFGITKKKPMVYKPKPLTNSIIAAKADAEVNRKKKEAERERDQRIFDKYSRI